MVEFEGGNPESPFVMGIHYNGAKSSGYGTPKNDVKAIHTRSGTKIVMNDAEGSILIEDPSGNTWQMDGKGNINVNAPNDISITAGQNISLSAGAMMSQNAVADDSLMAVLCYQ